MKSVKQTDILTGSIPKQLLLFFLPIWFGTLFQQLYNTADTLIVGNFVGTNALAAVGATGPFVNLLVGLFVGLCSGAGVVIAQSWGAHDPDAVDRQVHTALVLSAAVGALLTVLGLVTAAPMMRLLGTPDEILPDAALYLRIYFLGMIPQMLYNMGTNILRAIGDSKRPLIFVAIACVVNVGLDLLMVGPWQMGAAGAALATIISQGISVLLCAGYLGTHGFIFDFKPSSFKIHGDKVKLLIKIGLPSSVQSFVTNLSFLMMTAIVNGFGVAASAAVAVCGKFNSFGIMPALAMSSSVSSLAAQNIGAGKYDRAVEALKVGLKISVVIGIAVFAFTQLCPQLILEMFNAEPAVIDYGVTYLRAFCFDYLIVPFVFCINGLMLGAGHSMFSLVNNMLSAILLRVPVAYFVSKTSLGLAGVGAAAPAASLASLIVGVWFFLSGRWKKNSTGIHRRGAAEA